MPTQIAEAMAHAATHHRRTRASGFVPGPSADELTARKIAEREQAEASMDDVLDGLPDEIRERILDQVVLSRRQARLALTTSMLPEKREPVPCGIAGCGTPNADERKVIAAGKLVRVRSDSCNDPDCTHVRRGLSRERHDNAHRAAARLTAEGYAVH
jgi:hypothetical protein